MEMEAEIEAAWSVEVEKEEMEDFKSITFQSISFPQSMCNFPAILSSFTLQKKKLSHWHSNE